MIWLFGAFVALLVAALLKTRKHRRDVAEAQASEHIAVASYLAWRDALERQRREASAPRALPDDDTGMHYVEQLRQTLP